MKKPGQVCARCGVKWWPFDRCCSQPLDGRQPDPQGEALREKYGFDSVSPQARIAVLENDLREARKQFAGAQALYRRKAEQVFRFAKRYDQARAEVERLKGEVQHHAEMRQQEIENGNRLAAENARLREALRDMVAQVEFTGVRWGCQCGKDCSSCRYTRAREALREGNATRRATCPECEGNGCPICAKGKP